MENAEIPTNAPPLSRSFSGYARGHIGFAVALCTLVS